MVGKSHSRMPDDKKLMMQNLVATHKREGAYVSTKAKLAI